MVCLRLRRSAVEDRLALELPTLSWGRLPDERLDEPFELLVDPCVDGLGALRELSEHVVGNVANLSDPVDGVVPPDAESQRGLSAETGVVDPAQRLLVPLDGPGVECEPPSVGRPDPVDDDRVGVQLRIEGPARVLAKDGGGDPGGVERVDLAVDSVPAVGVPVDPVDDRRHGRIVGLDDLLADGIVAEGEQHGHGLGGRAGHVVAADAPLRVARAQREPGDRVHARHEIEEVVLLDRTRQPKRLRAAALPDAGRLATIEVVAELVLDVVAPGVGAPQSRGPRGHVSLPHERVHPSVRRCDRWATGGKVIGTRGQAERPSGTTVIPDSSRWMM